MTIQEHFARLSHGGKYYVVFENKNRITITRYDISSIMPKHKLIFNKNEKTIKIQESSGRGYFDNRRWKYISITELKIYAREKALPAFNAILDYLGWGVKENEKNATLQKSN